MSDARPNNSTQQEATENQNAGRLDMDRLVSKYDDKSTYELAQELIHDVTAKWMFIRLVETQLGDDVEGGTEIWKGNEG